MQCTAQLCTTRCRRHCGERDLKTLADRRHPRRRAPVLGPLRHASAPYAYLPLTATFTPRTRPPSLSGVDSQSLGRPAVSRSEQRDPTPEDTLIDCGNHPMARLGHRRAAAALRCVALALALGAACAHRPLLTGPTGGADYSTWQTALAVPWVTSSWSVKRIADVSGRSGAVSPRPSNQRARCAAAPSTPHAHAQHCTQLARTL